MNTRCLIQYAFGDRYIDQLQITLPYTVANCAKYSYDYLFYNHQPMGHPCWERVDLLIRACLAGYEQIFILDTDTFWLGNEPLHAAITTKSIFNLTYHHACNAQRTGHFNAGAIYLNNVPQTLSLLQEWKQTSDEGHQWAEQYALNKIIYTNQVVTRRSYDTLKQLSHRWNSMPHIPEYWEDDPVVVAWHGHPDPNSEMRRFIDDRNRRLSP